MSKVMVVGASRGIGLELTKQYAEAGDHVIACARDMSEAQKLDSLAEGSANIVIKELDIGNPKSIEPKTCPTQERIRLGGQPTCGSRD